MTPLDVDHDFFTRNTRERAYVLGAFSSGYVPQGLNTVIFRSKHEELVHLVKELLGAKQKVGKDHRRESFILQISSSPRLRRSLDRMGYAKPKAERTLPYDLLTSETIRDYVRGFYDHRASFWLRNENQLNLKVRFCETFVASLNATLNKYHIIDHQAPRGTSYTLGHKNSVRLCNFMYCNLNGQPALSRHRDIATRLT